MSSSENEYVMTTLEAVRDPFQILYSEKQGSENYIDAAATVWTELEQGYEAGRLDAMHVKRLIDEDKPVEAYKLTEEVLEQ